MKNKLEANALARYRLSEIKSAVEERYLDEQQKRNGNPELWKMILDCIVLISDFIIMTGLKIKWYNPLIIIEALKLIKNIVSLVIKYINEKKNED